MSYLPLPVVQLILYILEKPHPFPVVLLLIPSLIISRRANEKRSGGFPRADLLCLVMFLLFLSNLFLLNNSFQRVLLLLISLSTLHVEIIKRLHFVNY
jgi:hypothetical protein